MKYCTNCFIKKEKTEFGKDKQKCDGLNQYCKLCIRERSASQRKLNIDSYKKYSEEYREKNREVLRIKSWITYYIDWEKRSEQSKKYYEKHKDKIAKKRAKKRREVEEKEKNKFRQKKWRSENRSRIGEVVSGWKKRNPQKAACHSLVLWAVRSGIIKKSEHCEECGQTGKVEGHHEDYLKPLEVNWLCKECHTKKHRKYR